jgi:hypothetical protein
LIRQGLLHGLSMHLPHPWIATDAFAIGRISRHDFPRFWPELVPQLLATVRSAFEIEQAGNEQWRTENALEGLGAVVKELSSVKLGMAVSAFHHVISISTFSNFRRPLKYFDSWDKCINIVLNNGSNYFLNYHRELESVLKYLE